MCGGCLCSTLTIGGFRMNLGKGRIVPHGKHHREFYMHRSVKIRMEAEGLPGGKYKPHAQYGHCAPPTWVD